MNDISFCFFGIRETFIVNKKIKTLFLFLKLMRNSKGFYSYYLSLFAVTFLQMGCFVLTQRFLAAQYTGDSFFWACGVLQVIFIFPYLTFTMPAGFLSNKFSKQKVLFWTNLAMTAVMVFIALMYTLDLKLLGFIGTFFLATGFALHSPAKYGILKELFGTRNLSYSNALLLIVSVLALVLSSQLMILSTSFFDWLPDTESFLKLKLAPIHIVLVWILVLSGVLATLFSAFIPSVKKQETVIKAHSLSKTLTATWKSPVLRACILALAVFYGMAQVFIMVFQDTSSSNLMTVLQSYIKLVFVGLLIGGVLAARVSKNFIETGLVPLGALVSSLCVFCLAFAENSILISVLYILVGCAVGLYLVPLHALLQFYTKPGNAGRVLSVANAFQMIGLVLFLGLYIILLNFTGVTIRYIFFGFALISVVGYIFALRMMPQSLLRFMLRTFFFRFRLRAIGIQNIPETGPVLFVGNHQSFIDWAVLQMVSPRPLRIASNKDHFERWYLRKLLQRLGLIRIHRKNPEVAYGKIKQALLNGEAVVIFPEAEVSKSPHLGPFLLDFQQALEGTEAQIIPFYIQGLWGSRYSHMNIANMFGPTSTRIVTVAFNTPLNTDSSVETIRESIREISIQAWEHSISGYKPLASSFLRSVKRLVGFGPAIYNPTGEHYSGYRLLGTALAVSRYIKKNVKKQKNIGVLLPPSPEAIVSDLAIWMRGKVAVNLNYTSSPDIVLSCIECAEIRTIFTSKAFLEKLKRKGADFFSLESKVQFLFYEELLQIYPKPRIFIYEALSVINPAKVLEFLFLKKVKLTDTVVILFSSGSEGTPKGICLSHLNMMGNIEQCSQILNMGRNDVMLAELPMFHSFGLTVTVMLNLIEGAPIITVSDPTDVKTMARVCAQYKATVMAGTPTFLRAFTVNRHVHPLCFDYMRMIISGAEKLRPELAEAFRMKFGKLIFETYGCTETTPIATLNSPNVLLDDFLTMQVNNKPGTVGMGVPGTKIRIVDPLTNEDLPQGEAGMVLIGGCQVMQGYLKNETKTNEVIVVKDGNRYYRTGDKGYLDSDGFLTLLDRYSRFAKIGGEMISLSAVEQKINQTKILEGLEYLTVAVADAVKGEIIVLLYVGEKEPDDIAREIRKSGLNPLMLPGKVFKVESLPKLGSGKWDFTTLKQMANALVSKK